MAKRLILIFSVLLLFSCASRKVAIVKENIKTTIDSSAVVKVDGTYVKENNIIAEECEDEIEYKPLDSLRPMVVDGKQYINTIIKLKKKKSIKVDKTKVSNKVSSVKKLNVKREDKKSSFDKKVDKKANYFVYLWLLLIPAIIYVYKRIIKYSLI